MKQKILEQATDLFLNYGFKSVTMDDIAKDIGASKKTIYQHFTNKTALVKAVTEHLFEIISTGIDDISTTEKNPIKEIYEIKRFVMHHLKDEKSSPQYQLQKYYPKIYSEIKDKQFDVTQKCIVTNLNRGIEQGFYRSNLEPEFISRLYFNSMCAIKDKDLFPLQKFSMNELMEHFTEYHMRGICTEKGLKQLNTVLNETK